MNTQLPALALRNREGVIGGSIGPAGLFITLTYATAMELLIFFAAIVALVWSMYLLPRWTPLSIAACYLIVASAYGYESVSYTHLTLPTIYSV